MKTSHVKWPVTAKMSWIFRSTRTVLRTGTDFAVRDAVQSSTSTLYRLATIRFLTLSLVLCRAVLVAVDFQPS